MKRRPISQKQLTRHALERGERLTSLTARERYGIISFPKRISELTEDGLKIKSKPITARNKWGEECRVNEYWMEPKSVSQSNMFGKPKCTAWE